MSQGQLDSLDRAQLIVADSVEDPWRRALAGERLARAEGLVAEGGLIGVSPRREKPIAALRRAAGTIVLIVLLALGFLTQSRWWLIPLAVVHALLTLKLVDLHERRRALPNLLASRSVHDPVQGLFIMLEHDVARSLVVLARNDRLVIHRARSIVEASRDDSYARERLLEAERLAVGMKARPAGGNELGVWLLAILASAMVPGAATIPRWPVP